MQTQNTLELDLDRYTDRSIETFLRSYEGLIGSAPEPAAQWAEMEEEEHEIQRTFVMSDWGNRYTLGELYRAGRLTADQVAKLAELDRALLEEATHIEIAYRPSLSQLVQNLVKWGTPLPEQEGTIRLDFPFRALAALAQALPDEGWGFTDVVQHR